MEWSGGRGIICVLSGIMLIELFSPRYQPVLSLHTCSPLAIPNLLLDSCSLTVLERPYALFGQ